MEEATENRRDNAREVRLDRLVVTVRKSGAVPTIRGYRVVRDTRVRRQGRLSTYERVRELRSTSTGSRLFLQYNPLRGWLPDFRVTLVGDDELGITLGEIQKVIAVHFRNHRISVAEIALDFPAASDINEDFVLRFGKFGKTRRRKDRGGPGTLRYGSRSSPKFVRCYRKQALGSYRVELELHAGFLRKYSIANVGQLYRIAFKLATSHIRFVKIDWAKVEVPLRRRFGLDCAEILAEARRRSKVSLSNATRYLGRRVPNMHRYLRTLLINRDVRASLKRWAEEFYELEQFFAVANDAPQSKRRRAK
jgi:hypothetical protein